MITIEKTSGNLLEVKLPVKIQVGDFDLLAPTVDKLIAEQGKVRLLLDARAFDGWASAAAAEQHFGFVKTHQKKVERLALVAGHMWQHWLGAMANTFLDAEVRVFDDPAEAKNWLMS